MVRKKRRLSGFFALAALFLFAPLVAMAYELPSFEYDSSLELSYAGRIAQDLGGNVYVADSRRGRVYVFDKYGRSLDTVNSIAQPAAVAAGPGGEVYVASPHGVYLLGDNGQASSVVGQEELDSPVDMVIDAEGKIYLLDSGTRSVKVFSSAGYYLNEFAGGAAKYPASLAIGRDSVSGVELIYVGYSVETTDADNTETIFVYDLSYNLVRSIGPAIKLTSWRDALPPSGSVTRASGLAVDTVGRLYIADTYGGRINVYSEQGDFLGDYSVTLDSAPADLMFDRHGRLFVSLLSGTVKILSVDGQNVANVIPSVPSLLSPIGGMRVELVSPELVARNSSDPNKDNLVYEFELAYDAYMSGSVWSSGPIAEGGGGSTSVVVATVLAEDTVYYWRVRSFDGIEYSRYSYVTRFFVNAVNSVPLIDSYSPVSENIVGVSVGEALEFALTVSDSDRDKLVVTWFLNDLEVAGGQVYSYLAASGDIGENVIRVAVDDGELSVEKQWTVTVMRPNTAPTAPAINSPTGLVDVLDLRPELSISNSFDTEGDILTYVFDVSRLSNFSEIFSTVSGIASGAGFTTALLGVDLVENEIYYWRAKACETFVEGSYVAEYYCSNPSDSGVFFVNTVNDPVGAPSVASPASAMHVNTIDTPLMLSIDNSFDPDVNDVLLYDFEVALDETFTAVLLRKNAVVEGESGSTSVEVDVSLEENVTYYWRIRASDADTVSAWTASSFFVDNYNDAPTVPSVEPPRAGSEVMALNPLLSVINAEDLNNDALSYVFEIDSVVNFSSAGKQSSGLMAEGSDHTSWVVVDALEDNATYYWRVKANDGVSESLWSEVNRFFVNTANDAPGAPVLKGPGPGIVVNVDMPELMIYAAKDVDLDELEYVYQLSRSVDFSSDAIESGREALAWTVDVQLEENAVYYWRVRAIDEHGLAGAWSDSAQFMVNVVNENPGAPLAGSYSYSSDDEIILQVGEAVDPDSDSLTYTVEVYSDRAMLSVSYSEDGLSGDGEVLCNAGNLAPGVYYWRVRAFDGKIYGSWSDTRIIRVNGSGISNDNRTDKAQGHKRF